MRRLIAASLIVLASAPAACGEEVLREISWAQLRQAGQLPAGEVLPGEPPATSETLRVANSLGTANRLTVLVLDSPGVTGSRYALRGKVRYENVEGQGSLEMWNHFPDGSRYFIRTLAAHGLLKHLQGSCGWREFALPFFINQTAQRPSRLVVNVVFEGGGTVCFGPLRLVQYAETEDPFRAAGQWWGERTGGLVGGIGGSVLGCLGGLIGVLAGMGRARRFVMALAAATVLFGAAALVAGIVAVAQGQPYAVYYPLLLVGGLAAVIMGFMWRGLRRRYEQIELRRMEAMDMGATGSTSQQV